MSSSPTEEPRRTFPDWVTLYEEQSSETMPWFNPDLDADLEAALAAQGLAGGSRVLDLGTGPGTQAIHLALRGFAVTGADLSPAALEQAQRRAEAAGAAVRWVQDDILASRLEGPFEVIFDRGCFHVLPPERRGEYVEAVQGLLAPGGVLYLKCFSAQQPGEQGPYRFTPEDILRIFADRLEVESATETVYQGTLDPLPRALFCVLRRQ